MAATPLGPREEEERRRWDETLSKRRRELELGVETREVRDEEMDTTAAAAMATQQH